MEKFAAAELAGNFGCRRWWEIYENSSISCNGKLSPLRFQRSKATVSHEELT
jgi:hypothetical protein